MKILNNYKPFSGRKLVLPCEQAVVEFEKSGKEKIEREKSHQKKLTVRENTNASTLEKKAIG